MGARLCVSTEKEGKGEVRYIGVEFLDSNH